MNKKGKFIQMSANEFSDWINANHFDRQIKAIQNHHTYIPNHTHFNGSNHIALCEGMERSHLERGFSEIAQNITIFPDGDIVLCRSFNTIPAGIKGANQNGLCIENLGNFDLGGDVMSDLQRNSIVTVNASLLMRFGLPCDTDHVIYHHWWDLDSGQRTNGIGNTKSCPGTAFFGGNSVAAAKSGLLPLIVAEMGAAANPPAPPQADFRGEVNTTSLRIRDKPGLDGTLLGNVANGSLLAIYEVRKGWYRIHPTAQRWVSGRYVNRLD
ncbi:MAG: hypothetical protein RJA36_463 [Pseudomonadota bacterium]|jgi:hypothetical protein